MSWARQGGPAAIALDIELEDRAVMDETVDRSDRHSGIAERREMPLLLIG